MNLNEEKRNQAYKALTNEKVKDLYRAPESGETMYQVFTANNIDEALYRTYAEIIGDVILGFYSKAELPNLFSTGLTLEKTKSETLAANLSTFLAPLEALVAKTHDVPDQKIESTETATGPEVLAEVQPIRTMADDIEKVHGYGSYRATTEAAAEVSDDEDEVVHQSTQDSALSKEPSAAPTFTPKTLQTAITDQEAAPAAEKEEPIPETRWQSSIPHS